MSVLLLPAGRLRKLMHRVALASSLAAAPYSPRCSPCALPGGRLRRLMARRVVFTSCASPTRPPLAAGWPAAQADAPGGVPL